MFSWFHIILLAVKKSFFFHEEWHCRTHIKRCNIITHEGPIKNLEPPSKHVWKQMFCWYFPECMYFFFTFYSTQYIFCHIQCLWWHIIYFWMLWLIFSYIFVQIFYKFYLIVFWTLERKSWSLFTLIDRFSRCLKSINFFACCELLEWTYNPLNNYTRNGKIFNRGGQIVPLLAMRESWTFIFLVVTF